MPCVKGSNKKEFRSEGISNQINALLEIVIKKFKIVKNDFRSCPGANLFPALQTVRGKPRCQGIDLLGCQMEACGTSWDRRRLKQFAPSRKHLRWNKFARNGY